MRHASAVARWADAASLAREVHKKIMAARAAPRSGNPKAENPAAEIVRQFAFEMPRDRLLPEASLGKPGLKLAGDDSVERVRSGRHRVYCSRRRRGVQGCAALKHDADWSRPRTRPRDVGGHT